jgi:hypothetical protein
MAGGGTAAIVHQQIQEALRQGQPIEAADLAERLDLYQQGYRDALGAVAAAFGILPAPEMLAAHHTPECAEPQVLSSSWCVNPRVSIDT